MTTTAHNKSDKQLNETQKALSAAYNKAYKDIKTQIAELLGDVDLTATNPQERLIEAQKYDKIQKTAGAIAKTLAIANNVAANDIDKLGRNVYQLNYNMTANDFGYKDINRTDSSQELKSVDFYNVLALEALIDTKTLQRSLTSAIIGGILTKSGTQGILSAIKQDISKQLESGVKIATTVTTQSENKAIFDVGKKAEGYGKKIVKVWRAIGDNKTRPAHKAASGQEVPLNEPFIVGGQKLMYPGDVSLGASAWNTINCRCAMVVIERE